MEHSTCPDCGRTLWNEDDICGACEGELDYEDN